MQKGIAAEGFAFFNCRENGITTLRQKELQFLTAGRMVLRHYSRQKSVFSALVIENTPIFFSI